MRLEFLTAVQQAAAAAANLQPLPPQLKQTDSKEGGELKRARRAGSVILNPAAAMAANMAADAKAAAAASQQP
jgi:hypothetical protein